MIQRVIRFSATHRFAVIGVVIGLLVVAYFCIKNIKLDAIPDLSDTQVIVYSRWDQSPDIIEDQVTYPIVTSLLGVPKVKTIRGASDYGYSFVYVIFEDGTDIYWARSRVLEYLSKIQGDLPEGVETEIGPDATGVGWVFQYVLVDKTGKNSLSDLRTMQDFQLKYLLNAVPGVADVATFGGFQKEYQITVDPQRLRGYDLSLLDVIERVRKSNSEVGARVLELSGREYMVRGRGYAKSLSDFESVSLGTDSNGVPILLGQVGNVNEGPALRRGTGDWNGEGNTVGGIVIMRFGENALEVINRVKDRIGEIQKTLPEGVEIVTTYDRSELIEGTIEHLEDKLIEEMIIVSIVILVFLWHFPSAIVPILTIPISVLLAFIPLFLSNIGSNLMSLSGIAISIGVLVDGAIVEVENAYKKLEEWESGGRKGDYHTIRLEALLEVGPSVFFSLLVIAVAFFPIFTLVDQEGRLFRPLALSKNLTMLVAALLAVTLDPAVRMLFTRMEPFRMKLRLLPKSWKGLVNRSADTLFVGKYYPEENHPVSRVLFRLYGPVCHWVIKHPWKVVLSTLLFVPFTLGIYSSLGTEFMPPLYEGSLLYMPTTLPGISLEEAENLMVLMDRKLASNPEVASVHGKAGRSTTSTDPAPISMFETTIILRPRKDWREKEFQCTDFPGFLESACSLASGPVLGATNFVFGRKINKDELIRILDKQMQFPGVTNAWTMPIKARLDMLSTGMRTPVGIKLQGDSVEEIEKVGLEMEKALKGMDGLRSVYAERTAGGFYLDIILNRDQLSRYNLTIEDAQKTIQSAIGGASITQTVEGRERYSVNIRYPRDYRENIYKLKGTLMPTPTGAHIPVGQMAELKYTTGPAMIRDENGFLTGYVYLDTEDPDIEGFVEKAKKIVESEVKIPSGMTVQWSGQYENILRVRERLSYVLPITLILIFFLIHWNTGSYTKTFIVLLAVPFSLVGAFLLVYLLDYQMSIAVWVGMIALMGLDAETGIFMLLYLDLSYETYQKEGKLTNRNDLREAIYHGAVKRVRPKIMTVLAAMLGLLPIMWASGPGTDMMKRIVAPMVGGLGTSFLLELLVYPAIYMIWKSRSFRW